MYQPAQGANGTRRWASLLYLVLAGLILFGIFLQGFLIGTSMFAGTRWGQEVHAFLGLLLLLLTLLLPLAALLARLPGKVTILSAVLFVLTLIQVTLASLSRSAPFVAALHPANAMLMFGLDVFLILQCSPMVLKQSHTGSALPADNRQRGIPLEINLATAGYLLYALISVGVLSLFLLNRSNVVNAIRTLHPGFSLGEIDTAVASIQMIVVGAHIFFGICAACLAFLIRMGKHWVRIVSSVITSLALLNTLYEWSSPTDVPAVLAPNQRLYTVIVQIFMLLMLLSCVALQWLPQATRDFFSAEKRRVS